MSEDLEQEVRLLRSKIEKMDHRLEALNLIINRVMKVAVQAKSLSALMLIRLEFDTFENAETIGGMMNIMIDEIMEGIETEIG